MSDDAKRDAAATADAPPAPPPKSLLDKMAGNATKISVILGVFASGGIFGVYKACTNATDNVFARVYLHVAGVTGADDTIEFFVFNAGDTPMMVRDFRVERVDPQLEDKLRFGRLIGSANVPNGQHPVAVKIEDLIVTDRDFFKNDSSRAAFLERHAHDMIRITAKATYRQTTKEIACDVPLDDIRTFVAQRGSPPNLSVTR